MTRDSAVPTAIRHANSTFSADRGAGLTSLATTSDMMGWMGFTATERSAATVYHPAMRLVLASASPRRADLLGEAGLSFDIVPADVDERLRPDEPAEIYVARVAREKATAVGRRYPDRPVIAADTAVVVGDLILGKPADPSDAARMLRLLSGRVHEVFTGVAVEWHGRGAAAVERSRVEFVPLSDDDVDWYVKTGEALDKAGAYAIQGLGARFCRVVEGPFDNVVGLPLGCVRRLLAQLQRSEEARAGEN
ncbi:MAG: Maf family protein [Acidobacteriota bacterium]